jgi:hypothetical protein
MRAARVLLGAIGLVLALWGVWLMRDFTREQLTSEGLWLVGGVVLHDAVLAPVVVLIGYGASRMLPDHLRGAAASAFLIWGTLTIAFLPVLSGQGGKPGNDTILGRPYVVNWIVLTVVLAVYAAVGGRIRRRISAARAS